MPSGKTSANALALRHRQTRLAVPITRGPRKGGLCLCGVVTRGPRKGGLCLCGVVTRGPRKGGLCLCGVVTRGPRKGGLCLCGVEHRTAQFTDSLAQIKRAAYAALSSALILPYHEQLGQAVDHCFFRPAAGQAWHPAGFPGSRYGAQILAAAGAKPDLTAGGGIGALTATWTGFKRHTQHRFSIDLVTIITNRSARCCRKLSGGQVYFLPPAVTICKSPAA